MFAVVWSGVEWGGSGVGWSGMGWSGLNPNLVSALAPFSLVKVGAEFGAELDNNLITLISFKIIK